MTDHVKDRDLEQQAEEFRSDEPRMSTAQFVEAGERRATQGAPVQRQEQSNESRLLDHARSEDFRMRWASIQGSFVDEPKKAVEDADALVAEVMQQLARTFADERDNLESQWSRGADVSTEDLRIALQRYRAFFSRLLTV